MARGGAISSRARTPEHALTKSDPLSVCSGHLVFDLAININPCDGTWRARCQPGAIGPVAIGAAVAIAPGVASAPN